MHIHKYTHTQVHTHMHTHTHTHTHTNTHTPIHKQLRQVFTNWWLWALCVWGVWACIACVCVCVHSCVCVCTCVCACVLCMHTCVTIHVCMCVCVQTYICVPLLNIWHPHIHNDHVRQNIKSQKRCCYLHVGVLVAVEHLILAAMFVDIDQAICQHSKQSQSLNQPRDFTLFNHTIRQEGKLLLRFCPTACVIVLVQLCMSKYAAME